MNKATAVLLAGGKSTRFDPENLKTLHKVNGKTLTEIVVEDIIDSKLFQEIVLVYNVEHKDEFVKIAEKHNILSTTNGDSRFLSAYNGALKATNNDIIFIDVAAPFYKHKMLNDMLERLVDVSGVVTGVIETRADHAVISDKGIVQYIDRTKALRLKSYQGVKKTDWLEAINKTGGPSNQNWPEMTRVLFEAKYKVAYVDLELNPNKITTKNDLELFERNGWIKKESNE